MKSWYESNPPRILGKKPKKKPRTTAPLPSFMAPVDQSSSVAQGGGASSFQSSGGDLTCKPDHLSQLSQPFVEPISSGTLSSAAYGGGASLSTMTSVARGGGGASSVQLSSTRGGGGVMVESKSLWHPLVCRHALALFFVSHSYLCCYLSHQSGYQDYYE